MRSASFALRAAVHAALTANSALTSLLGGPRIYDQVPRGAEFPYVSYGPSTARDWSTGTEEGSEHIFALHVWTRSGGDRTTLLIMAALKDALDEAVLMLSEYRLINLRAESEESKRESDGKTYRGIVRFRAAIEPLP
ncbi:MAG: DUF3168 domain-containing protein [Hyphomicrobium sp.]|jgi:hypothetical protein